MNIRLNGVLVLVALLWLVVSGGVQAEDLSAELPRIPAVEPQDALKTMEIQPGFTVQQVAAEPLLNSPVAICFDADSRIYVIEMRDYSEQANDCLGQVRLLEDTDGDGIVDKATVFASGLSWPTAIICYDGGVFVGAPPHIYYLKDTDGDGVADEKRIVFTGFGRSNVQGLMNTFLWGLDNRIHGVGSINGGVIKKWGLADDPGVNIRNRDFSFDPKTLDFRTESGGGQHGMSFDDWGRKFTCANSRYADFILFDQRYVARNPFMTAPIPLVSIADAGFMPPVYRSSPAEPWRVVRTRMRREGAFRGPRIEGNGQATGYFIAATGITLFRGDAMGDEFRQMAVIGDVGSNLVHRRKLIPTGITYLAQRVEQEAEFLRSSDIWFRPVQFANAPDGCLYIVDMYREVIEHPHSFPDEIKKHLDLTSGRDRGRLYRVFQEGATLRKPQQLSKLSSTELVDMLTHPNAWNREAASRLLYERGDDSVVPQLRQMVRTCDAPLGRIHALFALNGLGELDEESVIVALQDTQPEIREAALRLAEQFSQSNEVAAKVGALARDDSPRVRYQLAFSAGEFPLEKRLPWLEEVARRDGSQPPFCTAIQSSVAQGADKLFNTLLSNELPAPEVLRSPLLPSLAEQVSRQSKGKEINTTLERVLALPDEQDALRTRLILALIPHNAYVRERLSSGEDAHVLKSLIQQARADLDSKKPAAKRLAAISILELSTDSDDRDRLLELLAPHESVEIQSAALAGLATQSAPEIAEGILDRWAEMTPSIRTRAEELLFSRNEWVQIAFNRMESGQLSASDVSKARLSAVMAGNNPELKQQAKRLHDSLGMTSRAQVLKDFAEALTLPGNPQKGKQLFARHCATCHRLEDVGYEVGPSLATIKNRGLETIYVNILDPNREVNPDYLNYVIALTDGRTQSGMIRGESATSLTILRAEGQTNSLLRSEIDQIRNTGVSLMPEELEKQFTPQSLADLLAYLMTVP